MSLLRQQRRDIQTTKNYDAVRLKTKALARLDPTQTGTVSRR
jgi:hypothetical protein